MNLLKIILIWILSKKLILLENKFNENFFASQKKEKLWKWQRWSQCKLSDECTWRRMSLPSRNFYKCKQVVYVIVVCVFCLRFSLQSCCCLFTCLSPFLYCTVVVAWLLLYLFFLILMLLLYFCLFIDYVNKSICFVFWRFCLSF